MVDAFFNKTSAMLVSKPITKWFFQNLAIIIVQPNETLLQNKFSKNNIW